MLSIDSCEGVISFCVIFLLLKLPIPTPYHLPLAFSFDIASSLVSKEVPSPKVISASFTLVAKVAGVERVLFQTSSLNFFVPSSSSSSSSVISSSDTSLEISSSTVSLVGKPISISSSPAGVRFSGTAKSRYALIPTK